MRRVSSTQASALLDRHPWMTRWQLWMHISGKSELPPKKGDPRLNWGILLEPTILRVAAEQLNMRWSQHNEDAIVKVSECGTRSCTIDGHALSIDTNLIGPGILECKNHDLYRWLSDYGEKPSIYEELQVQWQMMVTGYKWAYICVLVGGNDLQLFPREPRPAVVKLLEEAHQQMLDEIESDAMPDPTGAPSEQPQLDALYPETTVKRLDLGVDDEAAQTFRDYLQADEQAKFWDKAKKGLKVYVLAVTKDARETCVQSDEGRRFKAKVSKGRGTRITMKELEPVTPVEAEPKPSEELMI